MTKASITLTLTTSQIIDVDVDELVKEFGPKARSKKFLADYAVGNRGEGVVISSDAIVEFEPKPVEPKRRVVRY